MSSASAPASASASAAPPPSLAFPGFAAASSSSNFVSPFCSPPTLTVPSHTRLSPPPPQFFVDNKKGEINELRQLLRQVVCCSSSPSTFPSSSSSCLEKNITKRREIIKRVIAYMTLGVDVSKLFTEMIMASCTKDVVQKKMIYLFLTNYAESNSELAILAVNSLQKDLRYEDPAIRGLALRCMCSLRLTNFIEYLYPIIRVSLSDNHPYVRKTAIIGCIKLFHIQRNCVSNTDLIYLLYNLLFDSDPQVSSNAIFALNEILADEGGIKFNKNIVIHLLNRIRDYSEWTQCVVLNLICSYTPDNDDEVFDILNILDDRLKHSNPAVILSCAKCMLDMTINRDLNLYKEALFRLKAPLLTIMTTSTHELSYTVLLHIHLILTRGDNTKACEALNDEFKHFFCLYNEPSYIKDVKLDILSILANESNVESILNELNEYVSDTDCEISKKSLKTLGHIAIKLPMAVNSILQILLSCLSMTHIDYVVAAALTALKDILRKYREHFSLMVEIFQNSIPHINSPDGKAAAYWILGEFGENLEESPYILEEAADKFSAEENEIIKLEMLTAAMKLFFKKPPEMQKTLGKILKYAIEDSNYCDLKDRALFYYRLLSNNLNVARSIFESSSEEVVDKFCEAENDEYKDIIYNEFNSLSVVYKIPSVKFVAVKPILQKGVYDKNFNYKDDFSLKSSNDAKECKSEKNENPSAENPDIVKKSHLIDNYDQEPCLNSSFSSSFSAQSEANFFSEPQNAQNTRIQNSESQLTHFSGLSDIFDNNFNVNFSKDSTNISDYNASSIPHNGHFYETFLDEKSYGSQIAKTEHDSLHSFNNKQHDIRQTTNDFCLISCSNSSSSSLYESDSTLNTFMDANEFELFWNKSKNVKVLSFKIAKNFLDITVEKIEELFTKNRFVTIASGIVEEGGDKIIKTYFYAFDNLKNRYLIENLVNISARKIDITIKVECTENLFEFIEKLKNVVSYFS